MDKPQFVILSPRIDFEEIQRNFNAVLFQLREAAYIEDFAEIVEPLVQDTIEKYWFLMSEENYIEGEMSGLLWYLQELVNKFIPAHLNFQAMIDEDCLMVFAPKEPQMIKKKKRQN